MNENFDWTEAAHDRLRALWAEGHSTAAIGRIMGVSKNAIVGKRKRLGLEERPSPIKRLGLEERPARPVPVVTTLPPLASVGAVVVRAAPAGSVGPVLRRVGKRGSPCDFPIGDPRKPGFRFCEAPSAVGSNYCPEHHAVCWKPIPNRRAA